MVQNVEWKNAEWDKMSNEKTLNGTKRRIENRKEKYIKIFLVFYYYKVTTLVLLHTDGRFVPFNIISI